jgi:5-methylcytosine-specific restriction protein B
MTIVELAKKLSEMYENAPEGDKVAMIHLFGIRYSNEITKNNYVAGEIIKNTKLKEGSKMNTSYQTEISKGVNLSKYVIDKESINNYIKNFGK